MRRAIQRTWKYAPRERCPYTVTENLKTQSIHVIITLAGRPIICCFIFFGIRLLMRKLILAIPATCTVCHVQITLGSKAWQQCVKWQRALLDCRAKKRIKLSIYSIGKIFHKEDRRRLVEEGDGGQYQIIKDDRNSALFSALQSACARKVA